MTPVSDTLSSPSRHVRWRFGWPGVAAVPRPGEGQGHHKHPASEASRFTRIAARFAPFSPTFLRKGSALPTPRRKKVVGKRYCRLSVSTVWQREAGPRAARHEESPPTRPAGDRAQVRGGRPSALEQQRHVVAGPMRCANPERQCGASPTHWKRGRVNPPRANVGRPTAPNASDGPMERRILTGARPRRQVAGHCANALDVAAEPNAGPNRRGLTPLSRLS